MKRNILFYGFSRLPFQNGVRRRLELTTASHNVRRLQNGDLLDIPLEAAGRLPDLEHAGAEIDGDID